MSKLIAVVSPPTLEAWDLWTPWLTGIGGSETAAAETSVRLAKRGFDVHSWTPLAGLGKRKKYPIPWFDSGDGSLRAKDYKVLINFRSPELFDQRKPKRASWYFVAEDVDYGTSWTPERLAKVDRYLCLCKKHAQYTGEKYPVLRDRLYISSNGIRSELIRELVEGREFKNPVTGVPVRHQARNPKRIFYASSPDRGIKIILENWFRIRERVPEAEIVVAYGLDNMKTIVEKMAGRDWRAGYMKELEALFQQDGVHFTGRLDQGRVYEEWLKAGIFANFSDFAETNQICCQEAQALGAWPVANDLWATGEFVQYGDKFQGVPQKSQVLLHTMLATLCDRLQNPPPEKKRREMQEWALKQFDWERTVSQWSGWLEEDLKK